MQIKYLGPSPSVMSAREGCIYFFPKNEPVDVPDDLGVSLCEQDTFKQVKSKKPADPAASTKDDD
jgi:hypothetical protein